MDLQPSDETHEYQERVRAFLSRVLPPDWNGIGALAPAQRAEFLDFWRQELFSNGYLAPSWPAEYGGGGVTSQEHSALIIEFVRAGVPHLSWPSDLFGLNLIGPTILARGTAAQRSEFLPRILSGEHRWAQGFSEPNAGSDLFSLTTRAELSGDRWLVNGQKVWQTAGDAANWIFVLARTEHGSRRGNGLTMILVPMDQPGVLVRPIVSMTGDAEFCEVFFTDAETAAGNIVGEIGDGASVALTLLAFERGSTAVTLAEQYTIELERLLILLRRSGMDQDDDVLERVGWCACQISALRCLGLRGLTHALDDTAPPAWSSMVKLLSSQYHQKVTELAMDILGADGLVRSGESAVSTLGPDPLGAPNTTAAWVTKYLVARAETIYGGSAQIQRNTIAERLLGLPREPAWAGGNRA